MVVRRFGRRCCSGRISPRLGECLLHSFLSVESKGSASRHRLSLDVVIVLTLLRGEVCNVSSLTPVPSQQHPDPHLPDISPSDQVSLFHDLCPLQDSPLGRLNDISPFHQVARDTPPALQCGISYATENSLCSINPRTALGPDTLSLATARALGSCGPCKLICHAEHHHSSARGSCGIEGQSCARTLQEKEPAPSSKRSWASHP